MRKLLTPRSGRSNNGLNDLHMEISKVKKLLLLIALCFWGFAFDRGGAKHLPDIEPR
jgi:hypothetical protein